MKNLIIYSLLMLAFGKVLAQERNLQGLVFDRDSKIRLTRVYIFNTRTQLGFYNNTKGEFKTTAQNGDVLIAQLEGYRSDTVKVGPANDLVFYLKRTSMHLKEVIIRNTIQTPARKLLEMQEDYKDIYRKGNSSDIFKIGGPNGGGGVGLGIDALYSLFSREGKNARHLQKVLDRDYKEVVIDYRYTPGLVEQATGLYGSKLTDFMQQYRPSYNFILEANDYELVSFIQASYRKYLQNPTAYRLPSLKKGGF